MIDSPIEYATRAYRVGNLLGVPYRAHGLQADKDAANEQRQRFELFRALAILAGHAARAMASSSKKIHTDDKHARTERLEDVQLSFREMLSKDIPSDAMQVVLEIQCEVAYQISAIKLNNENQNNLSDKGNKAITRTLKVRNAELILRRMRDTLL